jgi:hypothetical protein
VGDLGDERIVRIGICKHGADGEENCSGLILIDLGGEKELPFEMVRAGDH